jgi:hypothetical protein
MGHHTTRQWAPEESPPYWFLLLEMARERLDLAGVQEARRQLELLEVRVSFGRRPRPSPGGPHRVA